MHIEGARQREDNEIMITETRRCTTSKTTSVLGGTDAAGSGSGGRGRALASVTPLDLPKRRSAGIAVIDVDNLVIGRDGGIDREYAMGKLAEVYAQLSTAELSLAVMSASFHADLGHEPWFRFPNWTWRVAEEGQDAADHQLLEFAHTVVDQREHMRVAVASGDGIFADLANVAPLEVVVPLEHHGVSARLRKYLRVRRPKRQATAVRMPRALGDQEAA